MKWYIRKALGLLPESTERKYFKRHFVKEWERWKQHETTSVPHYMKQQTISKYQQLFKTGVLVETGTYLGDMILMMTPLFEKLYTIELSQDLYTRATKRFSGNKKVQILQGDSGEMIKLILKQLTTPALFWLDGHYSEGITAKGKLNTPVIEELISIFKSPLRHIILIDDARLFNGGHDYPTLDEVKKLTAELSNQTYSVAVENDIIAILPKS